MVFERQLGVAALVLGCLMAPAVHANAPEPGRCSFGAFIEESDPAGLNVRTGPSAKAKILGTLPPTWVDKADGLEERVEVEVTDARQGWFHIRNAVDFSRMTGRDPRPTYTGEGWISGAKVTVKSQASIGRAAPTTKSATLLEIGDNETFDSDALMSASRPVDCSGQWVRLEFQESRIPQDIRATMRISPKAREGVPAGRFRVWVNRICSIQETSCDGLAHDAD